MSDLRDISGSLVSRECTKLAELAKDKVVLEVGSQYGASTVSMARVARQVIAVDWHRGDMHATYQDTLPTFRQNLNVYGVADKVIPVVATFEQVVSFFRPGSFDLAFIDAQHLYEDARRHVLLAAPLVAAGGTIVVHDYGWEHFPGVKEAVDSILGEHKPFVYDTLAIFPASRARR